MTQFCFGFAGIPQEIYEDVERENKRYAEAADFCIDKMPTHVGYAQRNVDFFVERFHKRVCTAQGNSLANTAFAIVYIERDEASTRFFTESFFPHMLLVPIQWHLETARGPNGMRASKNQLIPLLAQATARARGALRVLHDEVVSRASSTPILLPVKNFDSKQLKDTLRSLHVDLVTKGASPEVAIKSRVDEFKRTYPLRRIGEKPCFVDDAEIEFHPPGSHRHGYARAGGKHPPHCLLSGRRRLGAPYDPLFHYDCVKGERGNLKAQLYSCHEPKAMWEGGPNINVAPNDNVNVRGKSNK